MAFILLLQEWQGKVHIQWNLKAIYLQSEVGWIWDCETQVCRFAVFVYTSLESFFPSLHVEALVVLSVPTISAQLLSVDCTHFLRAWVRTSSLLQALPHDLMCLCGFIYSMLPRNYFYLQPGLFLLSIRHTHTLLLLSHFFSKLSV